MGKADTGAVVRWVAQYNAQRYHCSQTEALPRLVNVYFPPLIAFLATAISLAGLIRSGLAYRLALDNPNERSLHSQTIPRIGGLVIVPSVLIAWTLLPNVSIELFLLVITLAMVSYLDDMKGLPTAVRFVVHICAAAIFVANAHLVQPWFFPAILVLVIAWFANLYNFMDGADGLAGGMSVIGFGTLGGAAILGARPDIASMCMVVVGASAGFLVFNFHPAKVFLGDAGSVPLGFLAGAMGTIGWAAGVWPIWFPLLAFSPFVVDATVTLLSRIFRGEQFWAAHHSHYYQRLVRMGWGHRRTALAFYAVMLVSSLAAIVMLHLQPAGQIAMSLALALAYSSAIYAVDRSWKLFVDQADTQ